MRRSAALLFEYWAFGVSARTQPYAQGDMLPRLDATGTAVSNPTSEAAALTGNNNNIAYSGEALFDLREAVDVERKHYQYIRGTNEWKVLPLGEGDAARSLESLVALFNDEKAVERLFWNKLFKDFPSLSKPFTAVTRQAYVNFFTRAVELAEDEAAVQQLAQPFMIDQWTTNYIAPPTFWRIVEALADAVDANVPKEKKYERRVTRDVLERVAKISLNTLNSQKWMHEESINPMTSNLGGFRAWHEAGFW